MMSVREKSLYESFADLLGFPREDIKLRVQACTKAIAEHAEYPPEALQEMKHFGSELEKLTIDDLQGIYSYTFELTSEYTLDLGHYLYDGFKRSNYLASLKAMYRENEFPFDEVALGELPDHLPVLLRFLSVVKEEDLKKDVRESFVIMALEKLNKNFERTSSNVYSHLINSIYRVIDKDVKEVR